MDAVKLSVLMLTYNRPQWLKQAVDSVLASDADLELVLVDNGSNWETAEVISAYDDPRIMKWRIEHNDIKRAGDLAMRCARGEYVLILPDDDVIVDPHWLKEACAALDADPGAGLCWSWVVDWFEDGSLGTVRGDKLRDASFESIFCANYIPMSACVFRRKYPSEYMGLRYFGEWDIWLHALAESRGISIPRITTWLRQHGGSESNSALRSGGFLDAHYRIWRYWLERGYRPSPETWARMAETWGSICVLSGIEDQSRFVELARLAA